MQDKAQLNLATLRGTFNGSHMLRKFASKGWVVVWTLIKAGLVD